MFRIGYFGPNLKQALFLLCYVSKRQVVPLRRSCFMLVLPDGKCKQANILHVARWNKPIYPNEFRVPNWSCICELSGKKLMIYEECMTDQPPEVGGSNLSSLMGSLALSLLMIENIHICSIDKIQNPYWH
jgi:hypothetical protein